ncbi:hypothetical protein L0Y49_00805, partial [bacterium]|nr:hypothetical protein [bacterium]
QEDENDVKIQENETLAEKSEKEKPSLIDDQPVSPNRLALEGPEGWTGYWNDEWGIAFKYPTDWEFKKGYHIYDKTALSSLSLKGGCDLENLEKCNYRILISRGGRGLGEANWTNPHYIIGGKEAKVWEAERPRNNEIDYKGYEQVVAAYKDIHFHIYTDETKKITDQILETVIFY